MKKIHFLLIPAFIGIAAFFSSCSSGTNINPPQGPAARMDFKLGSQAIYNITIVDTADKNGNNADHFTDSVRKNIAEKVIDTSITFPLAGDSKNHVARIVTFMTAPTPNDTNYFYQDPNGDLYRYNFGFSTLNQFTYLTQAIGSQVDVGWVLAAKMGSVEGATWTARIDSVQIQSFGGIWVPLISKGQMMADTTFLIGTETIKARHARNTVTATANVAGSIQNGMVIVDSYYSTDINAVIEDFFRHVTLSGPLFNQQAQGKFKIMTSHQ